jgi:NitT/TauT family transport system permease protein
MTAESTRESVPTSNAEFEEQAVATRLARTKRRDRLRTLGIQLAILVGVLAAWEYLPMWKFLHDHVPVLDPYFISSPSLIWTELGSLITSGTTSSPSIWPYLWSTVESSLFGTIIGAVAGAAVGLWLSNSPRLNDALRPFITALNAVPRVALIPVIVIICGPTLQASILTVITVTFFIVFFSAFEGGRSVAPPVVQNAIILGASKSQVMWRVRARYVLAWTVTALPNAVSFGIVAAVTTEILTGTFGLGRLLELSIQLVDSTLTFSVVIVLTIYGVILVGVSDRLQRRWLRWWGK